MVEISILDHKHADMPNIVARGESEDVAVGVFVVLLNAWMIQGPERLYTNVDSKNGIVYTTFVLNMETFAELKAYMKDVYDVNLIII